MDTDTRDTTEAASYPTPVNKLLTYGSCLELDKKQQGWPNYVEELGLGSEHIPDLIRMATDEELRWADSESLEVWAPVHAWRALGQLRAEAAIEPLLPLYEEAEDDDWVIEELPEVYGMIGPAAIPAIAAYIGDQVLPDWPRIVASRSLEEIGKRHPDARDECVAVLTRQLEVFDENDPEMNGFLVLHLIRLEALEALPVIKRAFDAGYVDEFVVGDWDDVQVEFGLKAPKEEPLTPLVPLSGPSMQSTIAEGEATPHPALSKTSHQSHAVQRKTKNKMAKQSRKKNRKRR
jgi:hypothetical protein